MSRDLVWSKVPVLAFLYGSFPTILFFADVSSTSFSGTVYLRGTKFFAKYFIVICEETDLFYDTYLAQKCEFIR
jgi:hypothetical protein